MQFLPSNNDLDGVLLNHRKMKNPNEFRPPARGFGPIVSPNRGLVQGKKPAIMKTFWPMSRQEKLDRRKGSSDGNQNIVDNDQLENVSEEEIL